MKEDRFVGREEELSVFAEMLKDPYGKHRIMFIWGPGGIGKTWLVRKMLQQAQDNEQEFLVPANLVDMYATDSQHIGGVMSAIVERLKSLAPGGVFASFDKANQELQNVRRLKGYSAEGIESKLEALQAAFRECVNVVVAEKPIVLALDTFEHVHDTLIEEWVMSEDGLQMPGLLCIIAGRTPNPLNLEQDKLAGLSDENALELFHKYTASGIDSIPGVPPQIVDEKLYKKLNQKLGGNPLLFGIASLWLPNLTVDELDQLSPTELEKMIALEFHPEKGSESPLIISGEKAPVASIKDTLILMAYLNRRFNKYFLDHLVKEHFVVGADSEAIWEEINHNLYVSREFFFAKGRPKGEIQLHDKLAELLRLYVLPDVFADPIGQRLQHFADRVVAWYDGLIGYTDDENAVNSYRAEQLAYSLRIDILNDRQRLRETIKEGTEAGNKELENIETRLKTLFPANIELGKTLLYDFQHLRSDVLDRLIINLLRVETVEQFPLSEQYEFCTLLGSMAQRIYVWSQARAFWRQAVEVANKLDKPDLQVRAFVELANSTWPEDVTAAVAILQEKTLPVAEIKAPQSLPDVFHDIGIAYRRMYALDDAISWYEKSQKKAREYADKEVMPKILNDLGYALWLAWNDRRSRPLIQKAAELRELRRDNLNEEISRQAERLTQTANTTEQANLQQQLRLLENKLQSAELQLGMSYNTLGLMARYAGELADAVVYHDEALAIFEEQNNVYWRVEALHSRGDAQRQWAKNLYGLGRQARSLEYDEKAFADIDAALSLCEQVGFVGITPRVMRRMGRLLHDRYFREDDLNKQELLLEEALDYFEQSLELARKTGNTLEELETLTEIAFLGDDLSRIYKQKQPYGQLRPGEQDIVKKYVARFRDGIEAHRKDVPQIYQFDVFDNLLKMEEAALAYESGRYDEALEKYVDSFTSLARDPGYGAVRCRRHFDHLFENIRRLQDPDKEEVWCQRFMDRWQEETMIRGEPVTLDKAHPDLFEQFGLHIDMGFMYS